MTREYQLKQKIKKIIVKNRFELLLFTIYFFIILIFRLAIPTQYVLYNDGEYDSEFYYEMSLDISIIFKRGIMAPFCYRIMYPLLANVLPFSPLFTFSLISFTSFLLMGIILYYTLRLHFSKIYAAGGLGFLCLFMASSSEYIIGSFFFGFTIDPLLYLFFMCCFYAILTSNKKMYAISLFFGLLTKESILFTIPVFFFCNIYQEYENFEFKPALNSISRNMKFVLPTFLMFILLRLIIIPSPLQDHSWWYEYYNYNDYMSLGFINAMIQKQLEEPLKLILGSTISSWSVIFLFIFCNSKKNWSNWIKIYGVFMCCAYSQIIMGYHKPRLLLIASYPMIVFSLLGFKQVIERLMEKPPQGELQFFKPLDKKLGLI